MLFYVYLQRWPFGNGQPASEFFPFQFSRSFMSLFNSHCLEHSCWRDVMCVAFYWIDTEGVDSEDNVSEEAREGCEPH